MNKNKQQTKTKLVSETYGKKKVVNNILWCTFAV